MTQEDVLARLSPIFSDYESCARFLAHVHMANIHDVAKHQADANQLIWNALAASQKPQHSAQELHKLYRSITRHLLLVQTQRPIICSAVDSISRSLRTLQNTKTMSRKGHAQFDLFGEYSPFGIQHIFKHKRAYDYKFTFLGITKYNPDRPNPHTISVPIIAINDDVFAATLNANGHAFLSSLQDALSLSNHDYIHHITSRILRPYSSQDAYINNLVTALSHDLETGLLYANRVRALYRNSFLMEENKKLNLSGYNRIVYDLEGHALISHTMLCQDAQLTHKAIQTINTTFDHLETLLPNMPEPFKAASYYTFLLYDRLLASMPYDHPAIQTLEQRAAALPFATKEWEKLHQSALKNDTGSLFKPSIKRRMQQNGVLPRFKRMHKYDKAQHIRAIVHASDINFLSSLHYACPQKTRNSALPDLHKVFAAAKSETDLFTRFERIKRCDRFAAKKLTC